MRGDLGFLGGPSIIIKVLKSRRGRQKSSPCWHDVMRQGLVLPFLALEMEGAMSQGMQAASRSWKRQENRFSPRSSRRNAALPTLSPNLDLGSLTDVQ